MALYSPLAFLKAFESSHPEEVVTDNGSYVLMRSGVVPRQNKLPFGCSEAVTVQYLPRLDPEEVQRLFNAQVPVGLMSQPVVMNGASLLAANSRAERTGVTTAETAAMLAWGHASGLAERFALSDELGTTLRAAKAAWNSVPAEVSYDENAVVLIAAAATKFGCGVDPLAAFIGQCAINDPRWGASNALDKIDDLLLRPDPLVQNKGYDLQAELDAFVRSSVPSGNEFQLASLQKQLGGADIPASYLPALTQRIAEAQKSTRDWMETEIQRTGGEWLRSNSKDMAFTSMLTTKLGEGIKTDQRAGQLPANFDVAEFIRHTPILTDLVERSVMEAEQLRAIDTALTGRKEELRTDRGRKPLLGTPMLSLMVQPPESAEDKNADSPLAAILKQCGKPGTVQNLFSNPKAGTDGIWSVLADQQVLPVMVSKSRIHAAPGQSPRTGMRR